MKKDKADVRRGGSCATMAEWYKKICIFIIKICAFLILCIPLVVAWNTFFPFLFVKVIIFRILVELSFIAWMVLMFLDARFRPSFKHPLVVALSLFTGVLVLTMIAGVDWYRSFWSTEERMTGIFTMLHLYAWFLIMISVFHSHKEWRTLMLCSIGVSTVVSLYGFAGWNTDRIFSTIGNPTFFSQYIVLHIFLIAYILMQEKRFRKIFSSFLLAILLFYIIEVFLAGSRGSFIALVVGCAFFSAVSIFFWNKRFALLTAVACIIFFGSVFAINIFPQGRAWADTHLSLAVKRIVFLESYAHGALLGRPEMWRIAFDGWKEKPISGWGLENYSYIFQKYYIKPLPGDEEVYVDRSHNQFIDTLALTGCIGFGASIFLGGVIIYLLYSRFFGNVGGLHYAALGGFFISYFVQSLTIFDTPTGIVIFYFVLGIVYFLTKDTIFQRDCRAINIHRSVFIFIMVGIFIGIGYIMYIGNILPWIKDVQGKYAVDMVKTYGLQPATLSQFKTALNAPSFTNFEMRLHLAKNVFDAYMEKRAVSEYFAKESVFYAIREIDKSIANRPLDVKNYFSELLLYRIISKYDPAILEKAEKRMQEAYARAPNRPEVYREFPELYIAQKDYKKAEEWVRKGAEHFIPTQETHWQLAGVYFQEGDIKNGFSELMEAEKGGFPIYQNPNIFTLISQRLEEARKNDSAGISALLQEIALKNPGLFERIQKDFNH